MDASLQDRFPNLDQILGAYLNQDFDIYGPALEDAVAAYVEDASAEAIAAARDEIARFIGLYPTDLDAQLERLSSGYSHEPDMDAAAFLQWLDTLLARGLDRKSDASGG